MVEINESFEEVNRSKTRKTKIIQKPLALLFLQVIPASDPCKII